MSDSDRCFVDTNVWLYAFIVGQDEDKSRAAQSLLQQNDDVVISTQVINEVCVNLIKKVAFAEQDIRELIVSFYADCSVAEVDESVLIRASLLREQYALSYWDSSVLACALQANAPVLYTEDMQDGLVVENQLTVVNPFAQGQSTTAQNL